MVWCSVESGFDQEAGFTFSWSDGSQSSWEEVVGELSETGSSPAGKQMVAVHFVGACDGLRFLSLIIAHKFYYLINNKSHYSKRP